MADTKISDLTAVTDVLSTDEFVIARSGTSRKIDAVDLGAGAARTSETLVEFTSPLTTSATAEGSATSLVDFGSLTFNGTDRYEIEMFAPTWSIGTATRDLIVILYDGSSSVGWLFAGRNVGASLANGEFYICRILTPSAGTRTYSIRGYVLGGAATATITAGAGGSGNYMPGFARIRRA